MASDAAASPMPLLGIVLAPGNSVTNIQRSGQLSRFLRTLALYAEQLRILLFSYVDEDLHKFTDDAVLLDRVRIVASPWRGHHREFSYWAPLTWGRSLAACDILLVWHAIGALPAIASRYLASVPFVPVYDYAYADFTLLSGRRVRAQLVRLVEHLAALAADRIICRTPAMLSRLLPPMRRKAVLIPTGIDTALFAPAPTPAPLSAGGLFVGRLEAQKNLPSLLRAWSLAAPELPLTVIGAGSQRAALEAYAVDMGLRVRFLGSVPNDTLPSHYREAAFFVLPSVIEGLPKSLLEAMSCGLPCLGTDVPGIGDLLRDGDTGIVCRDTTPESLAEGLRRLRQGWDMVWQMGARARAQVIAQNSLDTATAREMALLLDVLRARG